MSFIAKENINEMIESNSVVQEAVIEAMTKVYLYMGSGLALTALVAWLVSRMPALLGLIFTNPPIFYGLLIIEIGLVIGISMAIRKISAPVAIGLFFLYAFVSGITLAYIFIIYTGVSIAATFGGTATLFGVMSFVGYTTKEDLTNMGNLLLVALIGLIIASVVNFFLANSALYWILTYAGIAIFLGLTIYHTQRIKRNVVVAIAANDQEMLQKVSILGALSLYLDFLNLFLRLLRIFGKRR